MSVQGKAEYGRQNAPMEGGVIQNQNAPMEGGVIQNHDLYLASLFFSKCP
jgi:hypothetical protein